MDWSKLYNQLQEQEWQKEEATDDNKELWVGHASSNFVELVTDDFNIWIAENNTDQRIVHLEHNKGDFYLIEHRGGNIMSNLFLRAVRKVKETFNKKYREYLDVLNEANELYLDKIGIKKTEFDF